ncbi:hypothetical protein NLI96_g13145 [Meripilus lineatus]|uniref:Uncharacterized protein n=1 Tax=Meripilus lineatus TaxID=2056292 RepID=A0AAD5UNJ1_9APHY|nr:hypothetical protein NLI96_g13145 [Physisporinus lineatus]
MGACIDRLPALLSCVTEVDTLGSVGALADDQQSELGSIRRSSSRLTTSAIERLSQEDTEREKKKRLQDYLKSSEAILQPKEYSSAEKETALRKYGLTRARTDDKGRTEGAPQSVAAQKQGSKITSLSAPTGPIGRFRLPTSTNPIDSPPTNPTVSSISRTPLHGKVPEKGTPEWKALVTSKSKKLLEDLESSNKEEDSESLPIQMSQAYHEYLAPYKGQQSLKQAVERLISKDSLLPHDIVDLGPSPPEGWRRFVLKPLIWENVEGIVHAIQEIIDKMISLIPDKPEGYQGYRIDRTGDLMNSLQTSHDVVLLCSSWTVIRIRLRRGVRFIEKYRLLSENEEVSSPVTTSLSVYGHFDPDANPYQRIKEYYARVPSMNEGKIIDEKHAEEVMGKELEEIILIDRRNKEAFPHQSEKPFAFPYMYHEGSMDPVSAEHVLKRLTGPPSFLLSDDQERTFGQSPIFSSTSSSHSEKEVRSSLIANQTAIPASQSSTSAQMVVPKFRPPLEFFEGAPGSSTLPPKASHPTKMQTFSSNGRHTVLIVLPIPNVGPNDSDRTP